MTPGHPRGSRVDAKVTLPGPGFMTPVTRSAGRVGSWLDYFRIAARSCSMVVRGSAAAGAKVMVLKAGR